MTSQWEVCGHYVRTRITAEDRRGFIVAECPLASETHAADVQLIAVAPELAQLVDDVMAAFSVETQAQLPADWLARAREVRGCSNDQGALK